MKNTDTLRSRLGLGVWESRKENRKNNWINISSNDAVKKFIQMSDNLTTKGEIEKLLAGEKERLESFTYDRVFNTAGKG